MGGSLHDARLGFFGFSRARHGVHGLHGARRKGACTMHDKHYFNFHGSRLHGSQRTSMSIKTHLELSQVSDWEFFRLNTKDMRMKISKPRECEKNNKML